MPSKPIRHKAIESCKHTVARANGDHRKLLSTRRYRRFRLIVLANRPVCEESACSSPALDIHHVRRLAKHPSDLCRADQVLALCHSCHSKRTAKGE